MIIVKYAPMGEKAPLYFGEDGTATFHSAPAFYSWVEKNICGCCMVDYDGNDIDTIGKAFSVGWGCEINIIEGDDMIDWDAPIRPTEQQDADS